MEESKGAVVPALVEGPELVSQSAPAASGMRVTAAAELDRLADNLDRNSIAKNTKRGYRADWTSWLVFCQQQNTLPLPAAVEDVRRYLAQLSEVGGRKGKRLKAKTAERHLAAISAGHRAANLVFDTAHPALRKTLSGIRKTYGERQEGARALRTGDIAAMCKKLGLDVRSVRNKAIILLGFAGGFRRSEIVALNVTDLEFAKKGGLTVTLRRSKTDQTGKGRTVAIVPGTNPDTCPVAAVQAWLRAAMIEDAGSNALFYPINVWGAVELNRLSDKAVDRIVKWAARVAGLKGGYSAHSLRAGHVTEAIASGADRSAVKRQTGHASDAMLDRYAREADLFTNNSSGNLGL
jgi:site-specific recombinase XerD